MNWRYYLRSVFFVLLLIAADQGTKRLAVALWKGKPSTTVIPGVLELTYLENRGAAFGLFQNRLWLLIPFTLLVSGVLAAVFVRCSAKEKAGAVPVLLLFLLAGAAGNLIDRIAFGYVIDFIYFSLIDFPVFNIADCYVTISVLLLCLITIFSGEKTIEKNETGIQ